MGKTIKIFFLKSIFALGSVGLSIFLILKVIENMGNNFAETTKNVQAKAQTDILKTQREAEQKQASIKIQQAQLKAEKQAAEEQARQLELTRFKEEIAQHQAEESKKTEFESQYKPREECKDPDLEWSKTVQCTNERMAAKEKFYSNH